MGNFNNQLGLPITILQLDEDTEISVLEMGMSGFGEIEFLTRIARPHLAVITNIGEAHMQELGSRAGIAQAKYEITKGLLEEGVLFFDGDEPLLRALVAEDLDTETMSFGFAEHNTLVASHIETTKTGSRFNVSGLMEGTFEISVLGEHQVKNALSAILISKALGLTDEQIRTSLKQVTLTDMRMQLVPMENGSLFINDAYNAAPTSMRAAIQFVQKTAMRPEKWLVLGDMLELGEDEKSLHEQMAAEIDVEKIARVCLYGPRMKWLYDQLKLVFGEQRLLYTERDYEPIIELIRREADDRTLILLKGSRGMKLENIIKGIN